jgi:acyl carrier protein
MSHVNGTRLETHAPPRPASARAPRDVAVSQGLRDEITEILRVEANWDGPFPAGGLDQHLDSMQRLALVVAIEDRYRICFEPEDEQRIRDLDDLLACIAAKLEEDR